MFFHSVHAFILCQEENYVSVVNDGTMEMDELANLVATHFELK